MNKQSEQYLQPLPANKPGFSEAHFHFLTFAEAYTDAANTLVASAKGKQGGFWAMPIVMLYRHAIELSMKSILITFSDDMKIQPEDVCGCGHNLKRQLDSLRRAAKLVDLDLGDRIETFIKSSSYDLNAIKSRYPLNREGTLDLLEYSDSFDLDAFESNSNEILDDLSGIFQRLMEKKVSDIQQEVLL